MLVGSRISEVWEQDRAGRGHLKGYLRKYGDGGQVIGLSAGMQHNILYADQIYRSQKELLDKCEQTDLLFQALKKAFSALSEYDSSHLESYRRQNTTEACSVRIQLH